MKRSAYILYVFCLCLITLTATLYAQVPSSLNVTFELPGEVNAIAVQSDDKIIIGGNFEMVNGVPRNNIARLNADGSLDMNWNPDANSTVYAVAVFGTNIYIGGSFTNVGGFAQSRIAKLHYYYGYPLTNVWQNGANSTVYALATAANSVYIGGAFTNIATKNRRYIAKCNDGGVLDVNFTNDANYHVRALLYDAGDLYVGGDFSQIGGEVRSYLAKLHYFNGMALAWDPDPNNTVLTLAHSGSYIYAGGYFNIIGLRARNGVAKIDKTSGSVDITWAPELTDSCYVRAVGKDLFSVYVAGSFTNVGSLAVEEFAKLNDTYGDPDTGWSNSPNHQIKVIKAYTTNVFIGGEFHLIGNDWAQALAKLNTNGTPKANFTTSVSEPGYVYGISTQQDSRLLIAGSFTAVSQKGIRYLVRMTTDGIIDTNWLPQPDSSVYRTIEYGTNIYAAGAFQEIGNKDIKFLSRLDNEDGHTISGWTNNLQWVVKDIALDNTHIYAGGMFTSINGRAHKRLARFRHDNMHVDTSWIPALSGTVNAIAHDSSYVYCAGLFQKIGNQSISNLARISKSTGNVDTGWRPDPNDWIDSMALYNGMIYASGTFEQLGGESCDNLGRVTTAGSATLDSSWQPDPAGQVYCIYPQSDYVYIGGSFYYIGGEDIARLARLNITNAEPDSTWNTEPNLDARACFAIGDTLYVGGLYDEIGGMTRYGFAAIEPFHVEELDVTNGIPQICWRSGSNHTFKVEFSGSADGPYTSVTNGLEATPETNIFTDVGRSGYPRVFYRVTEE